MRWLVPAAAGVLTLAACGSEDAPSGSAGDSKPSIVVTTNVLGDVVSSLVGDAAEVTTIMPPGASPHDFQASAQEVQAMREADLLIVNGAGFEEGLLDVIEAAEGDGVTVYEAISTVDTVEFADEHGGDEHADEAGGDEHAEEGGDEHAEEHSGDDPHFFTDPARMATAARGALEELVEEIPALDTDEVRATADAYIEELEAADGEVEGMLDAIPAEDRILVTNHEVFAYFADRYDFEVVGAVIPSGTTSDGASAQDLAELAGVIEDEGVPAIFADNSSPTELASALAGDAGDIEVVELFSESLGEPGSGGETYIEMVRTNAERITDALT